MDAPLTLDLVRALPGDDPTGGASELDGSARADLAELRDELAVVSEQLLDAKLRGFSLPQALRQPEYPELGALHRDLRDSLLAELPRELEGWARKLLHSPETDGAGVGRLQRSLYESAVASDPEGAEHGENERQAALAELLLFESVRLRLLAAVWSNEDFEALGGDEEEIDEVAWTEVHALLRRPELADPSVRPLAVMLASASVAVARETSQRAEALRLTDSDTREQLRMRAKLRAALRELRLPESVLLENALANILGEDRVELPDLQSAHPVALEGMSRQAMDQRVSRGRRALSRGNEHWPRRRRPALFDLVRDRGEDDDVAH